jgi:hypothetical protein
MAAGSQSNDVVLLLNGEVFVIGNHNIFNASMGTWTVTTAPSITANPPIALLPNNDVWVAGQSKAACNEYFLQHSGNSEGFGRQLCMAAGRRWSVALWRIPRGRTSRPVNHCSCDLRHLNSLLIQKMVTQANPTTHAHTAAYP